MRSLSRRSRWRKFPPKPRAAPCSPACGSSASKRCRGSARERGGPARGPRELDALPPGEKRRGEVPAEAARRAMLAGVRELGIEALPWEREARDLQARIEFVRATAGAAETGEDAWPAGSDAALADTLEDRKSTRLNSSHSQNSYAVFCL